MLAKIQKCKLEDLKKYQNSIPISHTTSSFPYGEIPKYLNVV